MVVIELARRAGVSPGVIRHYVRIGLLTPVRHPYNNYKLFNAAHLERLRFIRAAQALGLTLREIRSLLPEAAEVKALQSARVFELLRNRLTKTREQIHALTEMSQRICAALNDPSLACGSEGLAPELSQLTEAGMRTSSGGCRQSQDDTADCPCRTDVGEQQNQRLPESSLSKARLRPRDTHGTRRLIAG